MPKRSSSDLNQTAFRVVQQSTVQPLPVVHASGRTKNPAAVALAGLAD